MDNQLKVRFKLNGLEFEMEGAESTVKEEFDKFKGFVTDQLASISKQDVTQIADVNPLSGPVGDPRQLGIGAVELPALKEVVLKDLPQTEADWILIYSLYVTNVGHDTFTEQQIKEKYESTGRKNDSRYRNLHNNIKSLINRDLLKVHNDTEYLITEIGISTATTILNGKSSTKKATKAGAKEKKGSAKQHPDETERRSGTAHKGKKGNLKPIASFKVLPNLSFKPKDRPPLTDFIQSLPFTSNPEIILGIVYYCKSTLGIEAVTPDHVFTGFRELKVPSPRALYQIILKTKGRNGWLDFAETSNINYSIQGEEYILYDLPKKKQK